MAQKRKKNFQKIPRFIEAKLKRIEADEIVVASALKIPASKILNGDYDHLGIRIVNGEIDYPKEIIPPATAGRFSKINREGKEVVRKDLPMKTKTYSFDMPNWGDPSKGYHTCSWDREVYQRDFLPAKELDIKISLLDVESKGDEKYFVLKFETNEVISLKDSELQDDVFYNLNLLQENVGAVNVFSADSSDEDYLKTMQVDWELIPVGKESRETVLEKVQRKYSNASEDVRERLLSRFDLLMSLKPTVLVNGSSGLRRYFGAKFADDFVVFENLEQGNALYIMFENWEGLSKRSRKELWKLSKASHGQECVRIVHSGKWEEKLKALVEDEMDFRRKEAERKAKEAHVEDTPFAKKKTTTKPS